LFDLSEPEKNRRYKKGTRTKQPTNISKFTLFILNLDSTFGFLFCNTNISRTWVDSANIIKHATCISALVILRYRWYNQLRKCCTRYFLFIFRPLKAWLRTCTTITRQRQKATIR
jgi:hypothetical protein